MVRQGWAWTQNNRWVRRRFSIVFQARDGYTLLRGGDPQADEFPTAWGPFPTAQAAVEMADELEAG